MKRFTKNVTRILATALASIQLLASAPLENYEAPNAGYVNAVSFSAIANEVEKSEAIQAAVCCNGDEENENPLGDLIEGD